MGHYFLEFTRIARDKETSGLGLRQYKTEAWLQAELAAQLRWTGCYGLVPEVADDGERADLVIWPVEDPNRQVWVLLKSWQNSVQSGATEGQSLRSDVAWALKQDNRVAIALLPDGVERPEYTQTVLNAQPPPTCSWEVPFRDLDRTPRCVRVFCWYKG